MKTKFKITWKFNNENHFMPVNSLRTAKSEIKSMIFAGYENIRLIDNSNNKLIDYNNI